VLDEVLLAVRDRTEQYANNHIEFNHGRLRRGCDRCAGSSGTAVPEWSAPAHAFVQSIRRGHYELVVEVPSEPADGGGVRWPRHDDFNYDGDRGFSRAPDAQLQLRL
jgi:hypothetical protein